MRDERPGADGLVAATMRGMKRWMIEPQPEHGEPLVFETQEDAESALAALPPGASRGSCVVGVYAGVLDVLQAEQEVTESPKLAAR